VSVTRKRPHYCNRPTNTTLPVTGRLANCLRVCTTA